MRKIEIQSAVKECIKCSKCFASEPEAACPMQEEFGIAPFSPPGIFHLASGIMDGYLRISNEINVVPFSCTTCGACSKRCTVPNLHFAYPYPTNLIEEIRGLFVEAGCVPEEIAQILKNMVTFKNAWRFPQSKRIEWEKKINIAIPDYTKGKNEFLLFIGDATLMDESNNIPGVVAELLKKGRVDFGTLKDLEVDSGNEARAMGESGLFEELARENIKNFKQYGVKKVITISPHDYHVFRNDYPRLGIDLEVYHYTQIIEGLIKKGNIKPSVKNKGTVTYQDPCHLGRYNSIYNAPREIINSIPNIKLVEMLKNHDNAFCCGAGGGRLWYDYKKTGKQRISDLVVKQARDVKADIIVTSCPYCMSNLKASQNLDGITIKDVGEILLESIK